MPTRKTAASSGKKQAPMPGPNSAAYQRIVSARKCAAAHTGRPTKAAAKHPRPSPAFSSVKSRQLIVDRVKRAIWASVLDINEAIINLALCGNYCAAKALFDFAGVYNLPAPDDESAPAMVPPGPEPVASAAPAALNPMDAFFRSLGVEAPVDEPTPASSIG